MLKKKRNLKNLVEERQDYTEFPKLDLFCIFNMWKPHGLQRTKNCKTNRE